LIARQVRPLPLAVSCTHHGLIEGIAKAAAGRVKQKIGSP
jgi:hypothetical protein